MTTALFRQEAIRNRHRVEGTVFIGRSPSVEFYIVALLFVLAGLVAAAIFVRVPRNVEVAGQLAPTSGAIRLTAARGGAVSEIAVAVGDEIDAGARVAAIDTRFFTEGGTASVEEELASHRRTLGLLRAERDAVADRLRIEGERMAARAEAVEARRLSMAAEVRIQRDLTAILEERWRMSRQLLERGVVAKAGQLKVDETLLLQKSRLAEAERLLVELEAEAGELRLQLAELPHRRTEALSAVDIQILETERLIELAKERQGTSVIATGGGRVAALLVSEGETVVAGQSILVLVDTDAPLIAELFADSRALGKLAEGQEVRFELLAYPAREFGRWRGRVIEIESAPRRAEDLPQWLGNNDPLFAVKVEIEPRADLADAGIQLSAGMRLDARVVVDRPRLVAWVFEPFDRVLR